MSSFDTKKYLPHLLIIVGFAVFALFFSYPQLSGKVLNQHDIISWKAMSHEGRTWHEKTGENVLWSNSMFGGMPTYTHYVPEVNNLLLKIQTVLMAIGKPACFFFIAMLCFYILMRVLRVERWLSAFGALAYAFATYNAEIIAVGHETKMLAIGYFPAMLAGLILVYRSDYWKGVPVLGLGLAFLISSMHYQIVYYAMITVFIAVIGFFVIAVREKKLKQFFISSAISLVVAALAVGCTLWSIMPISEYNKVTMRGGKSELTINQHDEGKKSGGLDKDYAFRWSSGIGETFVLMIPYLYGGSLSEPIERAPETYEMVGDRAGSIPLYWGPQSVTGIYSGPVYFGAIICFLFVLGLLVLQTPHKWWILAATAFSIVLSWGSHFPALNYFLFDTLPMLNKFRVPSMWLVIAQLMFPMLGIMALNEIIYGNQEKAELLKKLKIAGGITIGLCLLIGLGGGMFFDYQSAVDNQLPEQMLSAIRSDRASLATKSALTSAVYILIAAGLIWMFLKGRMQNVKIVVFGIGILIGIDLVSVAANYLNEDNYLDEADYEAVFEPRPVDSQIMQDPDPYYRVLDLSRNVYNDAIQAIFHKCVGGYHPAKMEQYQDLIDVHMGGRFNAQVLNMLNTKYIIYAPEGQSPGAIPNPDAAGNAWFVNEVKWVNSADSEILALNAHTFGTGDTATAGEFNPKQTAVIRDKFKNDLGALDIGKDSGATVKLTKYGLNELSYQSQNSKNGLAVFSEMYYAYGWKAYVDGKETPIVRADYVLRAIKVPAGSHKIEFKFHPQTFYKGNTISLVSSLLLLLACGGAIFQLFRKNKEAAQ